MEKLSREEILEFSRKHTFFTWSAQSRVDPIAVERAEGVYFWDVDGKKYLDFNSMVMCVNIGHGNRRVIDAIVKQARELPFSGPPTTTRSRAELGKLLSEITPVGIEKFLFTLGGADANENAIKLARAYTGRHKILARYRSYHGSTAGALALTGDSRRSFWEPNLMPGVVHFLDPYRYQSTFHRSNPTISEDDFCLDYLNHLEEIIQLEGPDTIAGVIIEPVTGTNGVIVPPEGYLQGIRSLCDQFGIMMIVDEVMSGFGRTGKWFAVDHWSVKPDLITMAKGLTSGYAPLGAVGMTAEISASFDDRVYVGGLTYNSHPISLAAGIANINVIRDEELVTRSNEMGVILRKMLNDLGESHPSIGDVRSIGLFGAVELVKNRVTKESIETSVAGRSILGEIKRYCRDNGLYLYTFKNNILVIPPLIITPQQLEDGIEVINRALDIADREIEK